MLFNPIDPIDPPNRWPSYAESFRYAVDIAAKMLVLTHFSARYKGDDSDESVAVMAEIVTKAAVIFKVPVSSWRGLENLLVLFFDFLIRLSPAP